MKQKCFGFVIIEFSNISYILNGFIWQWYSPIAIMLRLQGCFLSKLPGLVNCFKIDYTTSNLTKK